MRFRDRAQAGMRLADELSAYSHDPDAIVLGLPRGGVPVAAEVARVLGLPLDAFVVRKLGVPGQTELAIGAVAPGGVRILQHDLVRLLAIPAAVIDAATDRETLELERRQGAYHEDAPPLEVRGATVLLVDDGLETGVTMRAAVRSLRQMDASRIVVAAPVGARATCEEIARDADEVVCLRTPDPFLSVEVWYEAFAPTTDDDVRHHLRAVRRAFDDTAPQAPLG